MKTTIVLIAILFIAGCVMSGCDKSAQDPLSSTSPSSNQTAGKRVEGAPVLAPSLSKSSPRSGDLHLAKECTDYTGEAGSFCTITSSNLKEIPVGSRVVYASALAYPLLVSDITLVAGPGNNTAFGHVTLNFLPSPSGDITFSGGTGKFTHFHASVHVSLGTDGFWHWDGTYSFTPSED